MLKTYTISLLIALLLASSPLLAQQLPQINYQGVARKADGSIISNQSISLRLTIRDGGASGASVYSETRQKTTSKFGLFTVVIGSAGANAQAGAMATINWATGNKFLQVELDPLGGINFIDMGTSQLQSVPYAIYAATAAPTGIAGGDLGGSYPNPSVSKLNGAAISITAPLSGQVLKWDGSAWTPANELASAAGPQGIPGVTGTTGAKGDIGATGAAGTNGTAGANGDIGAAGPIGLTGATGAKGDIGASTNVNLSGDVTSAGNATTVKQINGTSLSGLATGILKNTTTTGVPSIADAADFPTLNQNTTGNAASATKLAATKNINGVAFDGSADITITADAGSLTGTTLASNVVNSSLTSVGTLTNLTVTNPIVGSVTGSVGTVTTAAQPAITSVGTLTGLTVTSPIAGSITGNAATATSATSATTAGTVTTTAQPAITSVGTLTGLTVTSPIAGSITGNAANVTGVVAVINGGTGATTSSAARTNLGLVIGTNVQAPLTAGTDYLIPAGSAALLTSFPTLNQSTSGNASTATKLAATKNINGVPFDGTTDITISAVVGAADAGALTGTTLASNVVNSSLTSVGTLTNLTVTNPIVGSVTGSVGTVTTAAQPAITSVGILSGLTVTSPIAGSITGNAATATTAGTVTTAAQPAITSVGTLTGLTVTNPIVGSITGNAANVTGVVAVINGGTGATTSSAARTNLGLVIGTNVQAPLTAGTDYLIPAGSAALLTSFPTLNQSTSGNAATATKLVATKNINGVAFDGSADITITAAADASTLAGTNLKSTITGSSLTSVGALTAGSVPYTLLSGTVPTWNQNTTGNASTATKLAATKNINGVAFDGSADITITAVADASTLAGTNLKSTITGSSLTSVGALTAGSVPYTLLSGTVPTWNQNTTGNATNVTSTVAIANGGTGATTATDARTALGGTTIGQSVFTLTNPSSVTFPRYNADNTVSALDAATFRTAIGAGTGAGTVTSVTSTAGTGISVTGSPITSSGTLTITNTLPDQTVVLTSGTGISATGTYPNFTITNTSPSSGGTVTNVSALTLGTAGSDLGSSVANGTTTPVITLNVPTASAANRGALSAADWSTFNGKQPAGTYATLAGAETLTNKSISGGQITSAVANATLASTVTTNANLSGDVTSSGSNITTVVKINGTALSGLATGILKNTTTTGVPSIAVAADFPTLNQNTTGSATNVTGTVAIANGGTGATTATDARTALGGTTIGQSVFTLTNPSAVTFPRYNADNTVSALDAATFRTAIGAGTGAGTVTNVSALTLGTAGTDLSSSVATGTTTPVVTLNVPTASSLNRGVLSSSDWSTFNGKQPAGTYATLAGAETLTNKSISGGQITSAVANATLASTVTTNANLSGDVTSLSSNATTVVKINGTLLSGLTTGILKNTTSTGVPSIAVAADFPTLNQNTSGNATNVTGVVAVANGGTGSSTQNFVDLTTAQTIAGIKTFSVDAVVNGVTVGRGLGNITGNTAIGASTLSANTTGSASTANGYGALFTNTTGTSNTANGYGALFTNTLGSSNTANGVQALYTNTTGASNTANGVNALYYNTIGVNNTANGMNALQSNTSGNYNTANGLGSLNDNTTGNNNTANGYNTGRGITTGSGNTILGAQVGSLPAGLNNNIILANGTGAIKAQHDGTNWVLQGTVTAPTFIGALTGNATNVTGTVAIANGGTGATTASAARTNLGIENGTATGDMLYWNGTAWVKVTAGANGQTLTFLNGAPVWAGSLPANTVVTSSNKIWMDRNLGATQVATSSTDVASYGDLYQWGRGTDGHQIRTSTTTSTLSSTDAPGHANFITTSASPHDWRSTQNDNLWQGVSGTNNPCPSGYRLPTYTELDAERAAFSSQNGAGAIASPLKLPLAGFRHFNGTLTNVGTLGYYWTSTVTVSSTTARNLAFGTSNAALYDNTRAIGFSVRCLKD